MNKLCPIAMNRNYATAEQAECCGSICAWWCEYAKECAVPVIAGVLADSTICQNIWWLDKEEK